MSNSMNFHGVTKLTIRAKTLPPTSSRDKELPCMAINISDSNGVTTCITLFPADKDNQVPMEIGQ
jgi:hypothetical protein